jgi:hypothetical protein
MLSAIETSTTLLLLFYPGIARAIKLSGTLFSSTAMLSGRLCENTADALLPLDTDALSPLDTRIALLAESAVAL